ncbi:helix-turn-helix domain-containing protein [Cellulomonas sp. ATA003]|uniref:helix-turn-helix domain-containing protein n=1 Tax=Cellulomonas sp. ATA003 TaxID=3073064 RepID=UPI002873F164|nr:helix-turn-helix domain-containing protein [Cellulomonas sp. ATA003]WNB84522.1 helix-turn-helix domain-containing protein [Cellulomonas sp. ATA003]
MVPTELLGKSTVSVQVAAKVLGIGRNQAYQAAHNGELPTLRIGRRILVPVPALLAMVGLDSAGDPQVAAS